MSYVVNGKEYVTWSPKNQQILDKLINREVYCCVTYEMEYILSRVPYDDKNCPIEYSDMDSLYIKRCPYCGGVDLSEVLPKDLKDEVYIGEDNLAECPVCGSLYSEIEDARACCENERLLACDDCSRVFLEENTAYVMPDIYEWWIVSDWFADKLIEQGCSVIKTGFNCYWGRTTTGQSISLDGCVANIAKNMKILEGMENEWSI